MKLLEYFTINIFLTQHFVTNSHKIHMKNFLLKVLIFITIHNRRNVGIDKNSKKL